MSERHRLPSQPRPRRGSEASPKVPPVTARRSRWVDQVRDAARQIAPQLVAMRRHLHRHPELSDAEFETTEYVTERLVEAGLPAQVTSQGRGLLCDVTTGGPETAMAKLALRGDLDALPIEDAKPVDYRSTRSGAMHACGHDAHAAVLYGAITILASLRDRSELPWPIAVRGIFQPAEEIATGARQMIHHHALDHVGAILGLHVDPTRPVGRIGLRQGTLTAACDGFRVQLRGTGGHGARPHLATDPIDAAAAWVQAAYRRMPRAIDPHETVVVTVGKLHAGHSANVIPDHAVIEGTLRSLDGAAREVALRTLRDVGEGVRHQTGCEVSFQLGTSAPAVVNDAALIHLLRYGVSETVGADSIDWIERPSMGSEDFSYYLEHVPGAMFRLGVAGPRVGKAPLHTPEFDLDEHALEIGAAVMAATAIAYFAPADSHPDRFPRA